MKSAEEIEAIAATWLLRRDEPDWSGNDESQLQAWLDESYAHKAAYWRLEYGWRAADRLAAIGSAATPERAANRFEWPKWQWVALAASFAGFFFAVPEAIRVTSSSVRISPTAAAFKTALGGHEQVALPDGSTIELDTSTVVRAAVSVKARDVWLDQGEAFFSVKHSLVPFVVHAGPRLVTVLGTKFSVRRDGDNVRVAVIEGRVRVSDAESRDSTSTATIDKGDMLEAEGGSTLIMQNAEPKVDQSLAWRDGLLVFDRTPLIQAADEFNRYNQRKIVVTGKAAPILIGGSFKASNAEAFARLLHDAYGLRVEENGTEIKISDNRVTGL